MKSLFPPTLNLRARISKKSTCYIRYLSRIYLRYDISKISIGSFEVLLETFPRRGESAQSDSTAAHRRRAKPVPRSLRGESLESLLF